MTVTANQLIKLLDRDVVVYTINGGSMDNPHIFSVAEKTMSLCRKMKRRWRHGY